MPRLGAGVLVPHSTVLLPEVAGSQSDQLGATRSAFSRLDADLAQVEAGTMIVVSPHGPAGTDDLPVRLVPRASGHLSRFGAPRVALDLPVEVDLTQRLIRSARAAGFRLTPSDDRGLDHGTIVPLWLLPRSRAGKWFVFLGISGWPAPQLEAFGRWLSAMPADRSAILLASGHLSNREEFDRVDGDASEAGGACGSRPLAILRGASAAAGLRSTLISYEDPFQAGCAVALNA